MIFVDTNVLIDVIAPGQAWQQWSNERLSIAGRTEALVVNSIVVAELARGFPTLDELLDWLTQAGISIDPFDENVAFASGRAFSRYRRQDRDRSAILSDFLIGGHAKALGATLLTRDAAIYRTYFPDLPLITPETDA